MTPDLAALVERLGVAPFPGEYVPTMALKVEELRVLLAAARRLLEAERLLDAMRWRERAKFRVELEGRAIEQYLADSVVLGWSPPKGTSDG